MIKRWIALMMTVMLIATMPTLSLADAQMEDNVPVWTEETVRQYALDYISGLHMDRLYDYYDLQLERYTPPTTFATVLIELAFMTGDFVSLGSYSCFSEPEYETKTHILHLCMEKMDLDMYFTHKDKEDDWEVMAVDFVPAERETPVESEEYNLFPTPITETVEIGAEGESLPGILTIPTSASAENPVPACVFVHDSDALDADSTLGKTTLFADLAQALGEMGVATLRYDSRNLVYGDQEGDTLYEEVVADAILAGELLADNPLIDDSCIVVLGLGFGGELCPRIVSQSEGVFTAMIMVGATTETYFNQVYNDSLTEIALMSDEESTEVKNIVRYFNSYSEEETKAMTIFGESLYYFYEAKSYDAVKLIESLKVPTYVLQGREDPLVSEEDGWKAFYYEIGYANYITYQSVRGMNHVLMNDTSTPYGSIPTYNIATSLDIQTGRDIVLWILSLVEEVE